MTRKQLARYLVEITQGVFEMMIPIPMTIGKPTAQGGEKIVDGISAIIGIAGDFSALITAYCSQEAALQIAGALLDEPMSQIDEDVKDAIGELSNMLAGGIKGKFSEFDAELELAIPTVISGNKYSIKQPTNVSGIRIPFLLEGDNRFEVTMIIEARMVTD